MDKTYRQEIEEVKERVAKARRRIVHTYLDKLQDAYKDKDTNENVKRVIFKGLERLAQRVEIKEDK